MVISALLLGALLLQDPVEGPPAEERRELLRLLDLFDARNVKDLPFVRVSEGAWWDDEGQLQPTFRSGFLLRDDGSSFTVVWPDLKWSSRTRKDSPKPHERRFHEPQDFKSYVRDYTHRRATSEGEPSGPLVFIPSEIERLALIRFCLQKGLKAEAEGLWKYAGAPTETWAAAFAERLVLAFAEPARSRSELLDLHRKWLAAYPDAEQAAEVKDRAKNLERMIKEDKELKPPAAPSREEQVKALVRSLRDDCWHVPVKETLNLMRDINQVPDAPPVPPGSTTAERVIALGIDAVPALILALGDESPTRSVSYGGWRSRWEDRTYVRPVSDMAEELLRQITGFTYFSDDVDECRDFWESWRRGVLREGEEEYVVSLLESGGETGMHAAARLIKKWPRRFPAVIEAIRSSDHEIFRHDMLQSLSTLEDKKVTEFLKEVFENPQRDSERVEMARKLLRRGRTEAIEGMLKHWKAKLAGLKSEFEIYAGEGSDRHWRENRWRDDAKFLLESGNAEARTLLVSDLSSRPELVRRAILDALDRLSAKELFDRVEPAKREAAEREVEEALINFVEKASKDDGKLLSTAAGRLRSFWPDRYPFVDKFPTRARRRIVLESYNAGRLKAGLPIIELPKVKDFRSTNPETPKRVERMLTTPDSAARAKLSEELAREGLGAVPWIQEALAKPGYAPGKADLQVLANRLANVIREAKVESGSWKAPAELTQAAAAMEGKPAEAQSLTALVEQSLKALPDGLGEVEMVVDRLGDGSGVHVVLSIRPGARKDSRDDVDRKIELPSRLRTSTGLNEPAKADRKLFELSAWRELEVALQALHSESMEVMIAICRD